MQRKQVMKKKTSHATRTTVGRNIVIGAGLLAASAAAYYMFGPNGKANRKNLKGWMIKMKGEVVHALENAGDVSQVAYEKIIDTVASSYQNIKGVPREEVLELVGQLKRQWRAISAVRGSMKKTVAKKKKAVVASAKKTISGAKKKRSK